MDNCSYNKIKLMHDIACADWFIDQFAKKDTAKVKGHKECTRLYTTVQKQLERALELLQKAQCECSVEKNTD